MKWHVRFRDHREDKEQGAELVQLACCVPVFFIIFASCVQVAMIAMSALTLAGASSVGLRSLDVDYLATLDTSSKNAYVKTMICNSAPKMADTITVSDTTVSYNNKERYVYLDTGAGTAFDTARSSTSDAYVTAKISYSVPAIIQLSFFKDIKMTRIARECIRTDVSAGVR